MKKSKRISEVALILVVVFSVMVFSACSSESADRDYAAKDEMLNETGKPESSIIGSGDLIEIQKNAKIIRTVTINGETKDFDAATESLKNQLSEAGGYVEKSNISGGESLYNGYRTAKNATYTLRIPAEKLDNFLEKTEGMLNVTSSSESTTDVTLDYYDIESRMKTLEAKKASLEAMLEKAEDLSEIIMLQDELYIVISDIEAYKSQLNVYDSKVSYSTVMLTIVEVVEYTEIDTEEPTFGDRIKEAFVESWQGFAEFCGDFAVFFVRALPTLIIIIVIPAAIVLTIIFVKKRKNRK